MAMIGRIGGKIDVVDKMHLSDSGALSKGRLDLQDPARANICNSLGLSQPGSGSPFHSRQKAEGSVPGHGKSTYLGPAQCRRLYPRHDLYCTLNMARAIFLHADELHGDLS